jgi:hypothetical protein
MDVFAKQKDIFTALAVVHLQRVKEQTSKVFIFLKYKRSEGGLLSGQYLLHLPSHYAQGKYRCFSPLIASSDILIVLESLSTQQHPYAMMFHLPLLQLYLQHPGPRQVMLLQQQLHRTQVSSKNIQVKGMIQV